MHKLFSLLLIPLILSLPVHTANAKTSGWDSASQVRGQLLSAVESIGDKPGFEAALELQMGAEWYSYWKSPGDSGLAPVFDWSASKNVKNVEILWPTPKRKNEMGLQVFVHKERVTFPLHIELENPATATNLDLKLQVMVCKDICIPQNLELSLELEPGKGQPSPSQRIIEFSKRKIPANKNTPTLKINTVVLSKDALAIAAYSRVKFERSDIFAYVEDYAFTATPKIESDKDKPQNAIITLAKPEGIEDLKAFLNGKTLFITLSDGQKAIERSFEF